MADSLLLSLTGMIGTLIGSGLTGFLALRSEHKKQQALERHEERQSRRQESLQALDLRLEHHRRRRDHRRSAYQEFAEKAQIARGAALDYHRSCLKETPGSERIALLRMEGRKAHRDAVMNSYGVRLQGPEEVAARADDCIASLRRLLNCAEEHETRSSSEALAGDTIMEMDARIDIHFSDMREKLQLFINAGCVALDRPMPPA